MSEEYGEFANRLGRFFPAAVGSFLTSLVIVSTIIGNMHIAVVVAMLAVAAFGFAIQLEYELNKGMLSGDRKT